MDGEEYFIDANNNNRYDEGELFEDLGVHFMDKDENLKFDASYKNLVTLTDEGEVTVGREEHDAVAGLDLGRVVRRHHHHRFQMCRQGL